MLIHRFFPTRIVLTACLVVTALVAYAQQEPPARPVVELSEAQGTMLEINPDAESLLARAREYMDAGQFREALLLAQHVADNFPDALTVADEQLYVPARLAVQRMIREMPADGLNLYRLTADGEAQALVSGQVLGSRDEAALQQIVDRYLLSSIGDEAAYMLACLRLDRGDFRSAATLLRLIQTAYPDPTVDPAEINSRLVVALARSEGADTSSDSLLATAGSAGLPRDGQPTLWAMNWQVRTPLPELRSVIARQPNVTEVAANRPDLVRRWRESGWHPTTQAVLADNTLIFKSAEALVCVELGSGETLWQAPNLETTSAMPDLSGINPPIMARHQAMWPSSPGEIVLFGDRVGQAISVIDDVVYHIEGHMSLTGAQQGTVVWVNNRAVPMNVGNRLAAFDRTTKQVKWRATVVSRTLEEPGVVAQRGAPVGGTRFLCAPVAADKNLLAVIEDSGEYHLVALNPSDGQMLWRRFLCAVSPGYAPPWAPVGLIVEGDTAYIVPGCGLVIAADVAGGMIRWAAGYPRLTPDNEQYAPPLMNLPWMRGLAVWKDNAMRLNGDVLIVTAADSPNIQLIDRESGQIVRSIDPSGNAQPDAPFNYVMGVHNNAILVGGSRAIAAFDVTSGELRWRTPLEGGSTGRAVLTTDAIFASAGDRIVRIDPDTGKWLAEVNLTEAVDQPLGHLYCDPGAPGRLVAVGVDQAVAMVDAQQELERLAPLIAHNQADAFLARAALYEQIDRSDDALNDMRQAHEFAADDATRRQTGDRLFELLLTRAVGDSSEAQSLLKQAQELAIDDGQKLRVELATAQHSAATGRRDVAVKQLHQLALRDEPTMIRADEPDLEVDVAELAAAQLRRLVIDGGRSTAEQLDALAKITPVEPPASKSAQLTAAYRTILAHPGTSASLEAGRSMLAADMPARFGQIELALRQIVVQSQPIAPISAAAQQLIAQSYQDRQFNLDAAEQWSQLGDRFAGVTPAGANMDAVVVARAQLDELVNSGKLPDHDGQQLGEPPYTLKWRTNDVQSELLAMSNDEHLDDAPLMRDRVLTYVPNWNRIVCRDALSGDEVWSRQLPPDAESGTDVNNQFRRFFGGTDANVLVIRTPTRIACYDLVDGAILWSDRPDMEPAMSQIQPAMPQRELYHGLDIGNGVYVEQFRQSPREYDQLRGVDLVDGRELWRRSFTQNSIDGVMIAGDYVVLTVDNRSTLWVCEPRTGKLLRSISLEPLQSPGHTAWTKYGLLYQSQNGLSFAPLDGSESWSVPLAGMALRRIHVVGDRYAVAHWTGGLLSIIDTRLGVELWKQRHDAVARSVFDIEADARAETLFILGRSGANQIIGLSIDLVSGKLISRIDAGLYTGGYLSNTRTLARSGSIVPLVVRDRNNGQLSSVRFFRRSDGRMLDRSALTTLRDDNQLENVTQQPPIIRAGRLIVPTNTGLLAFGSSGEAFEQPPVGSEEPAPVAVEQPPADHVVDYRGMHIELRGKVIEVRLPNGSILRAGSITFPVNGVRTEIRAKDGRLQILENGQPVQLPVDVPQEETPAP